MNSILFVASMFFVTVLSDVAVAVDATDLNATEASDGYNCMTVGHRPEYIMVTNTCGVPVEVRYCFFDHPDFNTGDLDRTCTTEGVRTTGIMEPGTSLKVMQNVVIPSDSNSGGQSGFWSNVCGMKNRKAICRIPDYNVITNANGEETKKYRLLTVAQSKKLELGSAVVTTADEGKTKPGKTSVKKFYGGITNDGNTYTEFAKTRSEAKLLMEEASGRQITEILECSDGWYAEWVFEIADTGTPRSVGLACNAKSKSGAISRALEACRRQGSNCMRAADSQFNSRIMVDAYHLDSKDFDKVVDPSTVEFSTSYCHVGSDGRVSGDCYLKDELTALGVYFE